MHVIEMGHLQKGISLEDFNATARVGSFVPQDSTPYAICDAGTEQSPKRVTSFVAKSGYHLQNRLLWRGMNLVDHPRQVRRVILSITVECGDQR